MTFEISRQPTNVQPAKPDVITLRTAIEADKLTAADTFKRTYLGHGAQSSAFVFQGHRGPFRRHVHVDHDEIGIVLHGTGTVTIGTDTREVKPGDIWIIPANVPHGASFGDEPVEVLFVSSPQDDPNNQDRVWVDE